MTIEMLNGYAQIRITLDGVLDAAAEIGRYRLTGIEIRKDPGQTYTKVGSSITGTVTINGVQAAAVNTTITLTPDWKTIRVAPVEIQVVHGKDGVCRIEAAVDLTLQVPLAEGVWQTERINETAEAEEKPRMRVEIPGGLDAFDVRMEIEAEQDPVKNETVLKVAKIEVRRDPGQVRKDIASVINGSIRINGQEARAPGNIQVVLEPEWKEIRATMQEITVQHDELGRAAAEIALELKATIPLKSGYIMRTNDGEAEVLIKRIGRIFSMEAPHGALGQTMTITMPDMADAYTRTVRWSCGSESGTIAAEAPRGSLTWMPPLTLAEQGPETNSLLVELIAETYQDGELNGDFTAMATVDIPMGLQPTVSVKLEYITAFPTIAAGKSKVRVRAPGRASLGARITRRRVTVKAGDWAQEGDGEDITFEIQGTGMLSATAEIWDSRGRYCAAGVSRDYVYEYIPPTAEILDVYRCDADGNPQDEGGYAKVHYHGTVGTRRLLDTKMSLLLGVRGSEDRTEYILKDDFDRLEWELDGEIILPVSLDQMYDVIMRVDNGGYEVLDSEPGLVPLAFILADFCRETKAVGIGMRARNAGKLNIGMDIEMEGHRIGGLADPVGEGDAVTLRHLQTVIAQLNNQINELRKEIPGAMVAAINVVYPAGAEVTCSKDSTVLTATDSSGAYLFSLPELGTWTISCQRGDESKTMQVRMEQLHQVEKVRVVFPVTLYDNGDKCEDVSGGIRLYKGSGGSYKDNADNIYLSYTGTSNRNASLTINQKQDLTGYSKICVDADITASSGDSRYGLFVGVTDSYDKQTFEQYADSIRTRATGRRVIEYTIPEAYQGEYYIMIANAVAKAYIYKVWIE